MLNFVAINRLLLRGLNNYQRILSSYKIFTEGIDGDYKAISASFRHLCDEYKYVPL